MPTMRKAGWFDGIVEEVSGEVGGPGFFLRDGPVDSLTLARFLEGGGIFSCFCPKCTALSPQTDENRDIADTSLGRRNN